MRKLAVINRKRLFIVASCITAVAAICVGFIKLNYRINFSESHVPIGIYKAFPIEENDELYVGDIIGFNINDLFLYNPAIYDANVPIAGPRHLKVVAALPGAVIERSGDFVIINGVMFDKAQIIKEKILCKAEYPIVVRDNHVWLMANSLYSYDSRYYGEVPVKIIKEKNIPVFTRKK